MRWLGLILVAMALCAPASAWAGEPPNQDDPCSKDGRNTCGTLGAGRYENYRYGLRWFGDYRGAVPGVRDPTFCIDLRYWYPGRAFGYEPRSAAGLRNREGEAISKADLARMAYAVWADGRTSSASQQAAAMLYVHSLMRDGAPGEVDPDAVGVRDRFDAIVRNADRFAGPYRVRAEVGDGLVAGKSARLSVGVESASGAPMANATVRLDADGAKGLPAKVRTNGAGAASVAFTPSSAKRDLEVTVTAVGLAAPEPALYVPTKGQAARNGQRLVAPASEPYADTLSAKVAKADLEVTTAATPDTVLAGGETTDAVTIKGPGGDFEARVQVRLFGPFRSEEAIDCQGRVFKAVSYRTGTGKSTTPPIEVARPGLYAYQLVIAPSAEAAGVTTMCPDPAEVVRVVTAPQVVTQVSAQTLAPGGSVTDTVKVTGLAGEAATVNAFLYGPFGSVSAITCDGEPVWTGALEVPGDGEYVTGPVKLDTPGYYTYRESLEASDFVRGFQTECAEAAETTIVRGAPRIVTKVSDKEIVPGAKLSDTAVVSGLGVLSAPVSVELFGPYAGRDDIDCQGKPYWKGTFTADGDGEYETTAVRVDEAGFYTYREAILETDAYDGVRTKCGEAAETSLARADPVITTVVSDEVAMPGSTIRDTVRVRGLGRTRAPVEVELFGPFATRADISCSGKPYARSTFVARGDGTYRSAPEKVARAGFYSYREAIRAAPGVRGVQTECAEVAETSLGRPLVLTGRGGRARLGPSPARGDDRPQPTRVRLARLGIDAPLSAIGIDLREGALGIDPDVSQVGWWRDGAAPGDARGALLLAGHVDSATQGAGAFFALKDARRGDTVEVALAGGGTRRYRVRSVRETLKADLPADIFSRKGDHRLVLVTCGGPFLADQGHYRDNIVVTAVPV